MLVYVFVCVGATMQMAPHLCWVVKRPAPSVTLFSFENKNKNKEA